MAHARAETLEVEATNADGPRHDERVARVAPMGRWLRVAEAFGERREWGVRDLAASVGLPHTVVHRILRSMVEEGMITVTGRPVRFFVGPRLMRLASRVTKQTSLEALGRGILAETSRQCGETVMIGVYDRQSRRFAVIDAIESPHAVRYASELLRSWSELHVGASGRGILAFLPSDEVEEILAAAKFKEANAVDAVRDHIREARARGYATSHGERGAGGVGAAAPIRDATGAVVGDIIISWPESRGGVRRALELGPLAAAAAADLSRALGYVADRD
jgi:DNA-binding IclR family transcriptional regulator